MGESKRYKLWVRKKRKIHGRLNASWKISFLAVNGQSFLVIDGYLQDLKRCYHPTTTLLLPSNYHSAVTIQRPLCSYHPTTTLLLASNYHSAVSIQLPLCCYHPTTTA